MSKTRARTPRTVNGIAASLMTAKDLVEKDRQNQKMARAVVQTAAIMTAINAANDRA